MWRSEKVKVVMLEALYIFNWEELLFALMVWEETLAVLFWDETLAVLFKEGSFERVICPDVSGLANKVFLLQWKQQIHFYLYLGLL